MKTVLIVMTALMLSGCYKCSVGYSSTCGDYPRLEDDKYREEYEQKLEKEKSKKNTSGIDKYKGI